MTRAGAICSTRLGPPSENWGALMCGPFSAPRNSFGTRKKYLREKKSREDVVRHNFQRWNLCFHKNASILRRAMIIAEKSTLDEPFGNFQAAYSTYARCCSPPWKFPDVWRTFVLAVVCIPTAMIAVL